MGKFANFKQDMTTDEIRNAVKEAQDNNREVPKGEYVGKIEKMELGSTKDGRPMLKVQFRITEGEFKKHCLFMNRVVYGTKNDMGMIASVEGWVNELLQAADEPLVFNGDYDQFNDDIMDIAEIIEADIFDVSYDPDAFNNISIL